jgi:predicted AAA+ superfamily ATPase
MNSPFKYGKVLPGKQFINRTDDIKRIQNNISVGINTILISPRRWGKSSIMKQIESLNKDKKLRFAFIDFSVSFSWNGQIKQEMGSLIYLKPLPGKRD